MKLLTKRIIRRSALRSARFLLAIPAGIFWQCAAWRAQLDTRLENERDGE